MSSANSADSPLASLVASAAFPDVNTLASAMAAVNLTGGTSPTPPAVPVAASGISSISPFSSTPIMSGDADTPASDLGGDGGVSGSVETGDASTSHDDVAVPAAADGDAGATSDDSGDGSATVTRSN